MLIRHVTTGSEIPANNSPWCSVSLGDAFPYHNSPFEFRYLSQNMHLLNFDSSENKSASQQYNLEIIYWRLKIL